jgi:hypothetical protein
MMWRKSDQILGRRLSRCHPRDTQGQPARRERWLILRTPIANVRSAGNARLSAERARFRRWRTPATG